MNTLILYGGKYGSTEKCAHLLAQELPGSTKVVNMLSETPPSLEGYDAVAIGSSVYVGKVQTAVSNFCTSNAETLATKRLGLFICAGNVEQADTQLKQNFSETLVAKAAATAHFGYALQLKKMNLIERTAVKMIMKTKESCEHIYKDKIKDFANSLSASLQ